MQLISADFNMQLCHFFQFDAELQRQVHFLTIAHVMAGTSNGGQRRYAGAARADRQSGKQ